MSRLVIILTVYLSIGILIAYSPFHYLRGIDKRIRSGDYNSLEVYDLLLFNTVVSSSGRLTKIAIFIFVMLFYPVLIVKYVTKKVKNYKRLKK